MKTTILCIGDPHIQVNNIKEVDIFLEKIREVIIEKKPDLIVVLGDILHTHERVHTIALNKAYEMINLFRSFTQTYVLVGNHDAINNQIFLTDNHWLSGMKEWKNTVIVDKVVCKKINNEKFFFVPYVPPGRFEEALNTFEDEKWNDSSCIFAHQEFFGCKMGAIISVEGDKWPLDNPNVVSGHIHSRQIPQPNIYYTGSAIQHAFGENDKKTIAYLTFINNNEYIREEIYLMLPRKKIMYMDVEDLEDFTIKDTTDKIKITISGNYEQFKAFRKTKKYKTILDKGVKIAFKPKKIDQNEKQNELTNINEEIKFKSILEKIVAKENNPYLMEVYQLVFMNK